MDLRAGPSTVEAGTQSRPLRGKVLARPSSSCADGDDCLRVPPMSPAQKSEAGKKESTARPLNRRCRRSAMPSSTSLCDQVLSRRRVARLTNCRSTLPGGTPSTSAGATRQPARARRRLVAPDMGHTDRTAGADRACGASLSGREGNLVLNYFLLRKAASAAGLPSQRRRPNPHRKRTGSSDKPPGRRQHRGRLTPARGTSGICGQGGDRPPQLTKLRVNCDLPLRWATRVRRLPRFDRVAEATRWPAKVFHGPCRGTRHLASNGISPKD